MRLLIVDDEPLARLRLKALLQDIDPNATCGEAADGAEALALVQRDAPDVVLLDIRMPGPSGLTVAETLATLPAAPVVVFTTASDEHALAAFEARAVDYLLKPVRRERLAAALDRARRLLAEADGAEAAAPGPVLAGTRGGRQLMAPIARVHALRSDSKYTRVLWEGSDFYLDTPLKELERRLGEAFVRVHRGALVQLAAIEALERDPRGRLALKLTGTEERIPVARRLAPQLRERLAALGGPEEGNGASEP